MSRPSDHIDSPIPEPKGDRITQPKLDLIGYLRFFWRQLTSMRTALFLLLLLAIAAIPGSLVPQRTSDPNGVIKYFEDNPDLAPILDNLQAFDVYTSVWFSSIYLLLFLSLIGCVIPRTMHHLKALRTPPPKTPARLDRLAGFTTNSFSASGTPEASVSAASAIESARALLRRSGYRARLFDGPQLSVSAERGYLRETGNLVFHTALIGVLASVAIGGGFAYSGQKVVVEGQPFVNVLADYSSFNPGRFFDESALTPYRMVLDDFDVVYERDNFNAYGFPTDFTADVSVHVPGEDSYRDQVKVNHPLHVLGNETYLLGNGYAPHITVTDGEGNIAFTGTVPFLSQDANLTSIGVVKVPDAVPEQLGLVGFFYPTAEELETGAFTSAFPDLRGPLLTFNVFTGDLGVDDGIPRSVYALNTDKMTQVAGRGTDVPGLELRPGEAVELPNGLGTVTFDDLTESSADGTSVPRFASFDIHHDPSQGWVLTFAILVILGLLTALFVPRRRLWVKAIELPDGGIRLEYAGLARGDDPTLDAAVADLAERHARQLKN
ncbi:MAG TPA: cytochrome c biogenesis protein ResB [Homoserinimonas sp.]|nr:cytochrome c biogenesis protein ResB [Homoserinimonas sp.]